MGLFNLFKKRKGDVKQTYNGITFYAPKPISAQEYSEMRKQQAQWLEEHYDLNSLEGVRSIPVSANLPRSSIGGAMDVTGDLDYYLRQKAFQHEGAGKIELAILCLRKSNAIRMLKQTGYRRSDYYALVRMLARNDYVEEAREEKERIDRFFHDYSDNGEIEIEAKRGEEARTFAWIQQNLPDMCPKSLSGFRRMKKQNTKNYQKIVLAARELGHTIE